MKGTPHSEQQIIATLGVGTANGGTSNSSILSTHLRKRFRSALAFCSPTKHVYPRQALASNLACEPQ